MRVRSLALTVTLCIGILVGSALAEPRIASDQSAFNFGTVPQGNKVEHQFVIRNTGDVPLKIEQVRTSCGCTAAAPSSRTIAPGRSEEIRVTFDSANFSGKIAKTVYVHTNDPKTPVFNLTLSGTVQEYVTVVPRQLNLGVIKAGTRKETGLVVENRGPRPFAITGIRSMLAQVAVKGGRQQLKPGESVTIPVVVQPRPDDRILSGYLIIATDNPARPEMTVPVYATVAR